MDEEEQPKDLNFIPEVILKKRKHSEAWALSKKVNSKKGFHLKKSKDFIKKAEDFIFEYRSREIDLIRMKRWVKRIL
ncbi:putative ribosomal protein L30 [Medicago truncatula]|uniref:60S ribosomal L7-like protein n=1 Tax=Medicago truncatula TaxID=3880 RepID=G7IWM3_MEDTR|nr:60S ribosomal L7-like protein [Medicago truncatula]RHN66241.1 putative ribosomal protein L30 [Medicago truncatula]